MRARYLRPALSMPDIYLYRAPVDFRMQAQGLAALVERELGHNPFSGALYAFTNRQRNKIKCVMWEDNGFVLYYKMHCCKAGRWRQDFWTICMAIHSRQAASPSTRISSFLMQLGG